MIKKHGFTLAEVLITLGIIGIVAALASPALVGFYQKSKVPTTLRKFMNTMGVANQALIYQSEVSTISSAVGQDVSEYYELLTEHVSGTLALKSANADDSRDSASSNASEDASNATTAKSLADIDLAPREYGSESAIPGTLSNYLIYEFAGGDAVAIAANSQESLNASKDDAAGSFKGIWGTAYYDINGFEEKPNRLGKDIFYFVIDDAGTIIPDSGRAYYKAYPSGDTEEAWSSEGDKQCDDVKVGDGTSCAASVMDNNWKVIYKY